MLGQSPDAIVMTGDERSNCAERPSRQIEAVAPPSMHRFARLRAVALDGRNKTHESPCFPNLIEENL